MIRKSLLVTCLVGLVGCGGGSGGATTSASSSTSAGAGGTSSSTASAGGGGSGSTAVGTGGAGGGAAAPTLFFDFVTGDAASFTEQHPHGSTTFGAPDTGAHDANAVAMLWKAGENAVGPGGEATEIDTTADLGFGEYRFRVRLATCKSDEELVNGHFVFQNDGLDHDGDGIIDNDEIDIEILCAQPSFFNLTSWTGYTDDAHMRKKSRTIDLDTGTIHVGLTDAYDYDYADPLNGTKDPALAHPGWYDPTAYYEMGWDWQPDHVRWFVVLGGKEITLWTLTDATRVPQHPAKMLFNLWHPAQHWNADGAVVPTTKDATLSVDWFSFTASK
jgi:hypothetical protein